MVSKQPRKKRKFMYNAPLHLARGFVSSHLSKELRERMKRRSVVLKKGFMVKILRGAKKGGSARVVKVNLSKRKVFLEGVIKKKNSGKEVLLPFDSSNLMVISV